MENRLTGVFAVVDHHPVSLGIKASVGSKFLRDQEEVSDNVLVCFGHAVDVGNMSFGYDKGVDRRLRIDVLEGDYFCVFMDDLRKDLFRDNFTEKAVWVMSHVFSSP